MLPRLSRSAVLLTLALPLLGGALRADTLRVPADHDTIGEAVAAAESGDVILISGGTYTETLSVNKRSGLTFRGKGKVTWRPENGSTITLNLGQCSDMTVENIGFAAGEIGVGVGQCERTVLSRLRFDDFLDAAVIVSASTETRLEGVRVDDASTAVRASSVQVLSVDRLVTRDCSVGLELGDDCFVVALTDSKLVGQGSGGGVMATEGVDDVLLRGNTVRGFGVGMNLTGDGIVAQENRISQVSVGLILGATGVTSLIQAVDNRITKTEGLGVSVLGRQILLRANRIANTGGVFVHVQATQTFFHGNRITGSKGDGVELNSSANALVGNVIKSSAGEDVTNNASGNLFQRSKPRADGETIRVPKDYETIRQALKAADDDDTILIASGTYEEALGLSGSRGLTLKGLGKVVLRREGGVALALTDCDDILIENLVFDGSSTGLRIDDSTAVNVRRCSFTGIQTTGIHCEASTGLFVSRSRFEPAVEGLDVDGTNRVVVEQCRFEGDGPADKADAFLMEDGVGLVFVDNQVRRIEAAADTSGRATHIADNRLWDVTTGIRSRGDGGFVTGNRLWRVHRGLRVDGDFGVDTHIVDNRVLDAGEYGVRLGSSQGHLADNLVRGSDEDGVLFQSVSRSLIRGNRVLSSGRYGLNAESASDCGVYDNTGTKSGDLDYLSAGSVNHLSGNTFGSTNLD